MDAGMNKALLRSRMKEAAQKREKRIDSPLVRYNELGQPVCKVCNVAVKSESLWQAHLVSRQHKEAVDELKAQAKGAGVISNRGDRLEGSEANKPKARPSSTLPDDFFDPSVKKHVASDVVVKHDQLPPTSAGPKITSRTRGEPAISFSANNFVQSTKVLGSSGQIENKTETSSMAQTPQGTQNSTTVAKMIQSSLPKGFFDNVDADYRARGLEPPKYDIQDEFKEFQKSIRDDIQEVDLRLEEEEFDAAEDREKLETLEQRAFLERIENLRKRRQEKAEAIEKAEIIAKVAARKAFVNVNLSMDEDSGSDGDSEEENLLVDWRAKQL